MAGTPIAPRRRAWHVPLAAATGAIVAAAASMTPSLMPRTGAIQGMVTGLAAASGYAIGLVVAWAVRRIRGRSGGPSWGTPQQWRIVLVTGGTLLGMLGLLGRAWQDEVRVLMGSPIPSPAWYLQAAAVALVMLAMLVAVGRVVRRFTHVATQAAGHLLPPRTSRIVGVLGAAALTLAVVSGLLVDVGYATLDRVFAQADRTIDPGIVQPDSRLVSGSQGSAVAWADLGAEGRKFVSAVPTTEQVEAAAGRVAADPIRVFVGLATSPDPVERATLALADLEAFGAFDREVLLVVTSTGTGWVDPQAVLPLELQHAGDVATVSTQYSHLPSWLSFLVDQERAREAARALFEAVHARWSQLPEGARPKLLLFGESLGSFAAESSFSTVADMAARVDGALLVGPPAASPLHRAATDGRAAGSPQWQPIHGDGAVLRFGSRAEDLVALPGPWPEPRLVYLQHASDPVVWWTPSLIWSRPDWLAEPPGPDVSPHMRWVPLLTFLQLTGDMMDSTSVPAGHGHVYGELQADVWAVILPAGQPGS